MNNKPTIYIKPYSRFREFREQQQKERHNDYITTSPASVNSSKNRNRKYNSLADLFWPPDDHFEDTTEHKTSSNSDKEVS